MVAEGGACRADPRRGPDAFSMASLTYDEAMEYDQPPQPTPFWHN